MKADIEVLEPDYIIMVKTIKETEEYYDKERNAKKVQVTSIYNFLQSHAKILPIYQMVYPNPINTVVNGILKYPKKDLTELSADLQQWYQQLSQVKYGPTGQSHDNYRAVFSYLDDVIWKEIREDRFTWHAGELVIEWPEGKKPKPVK